MLSLTLKDMRRAVEVNNVFAAKLGTPRLDLADVAATLQRRVENRAFHMATRARVQALDDTGEHYRASEELRTEARFRWKPLERGQSVGGTPPQVSRLVTSTSKVTAGQSGGD